MSSSTPQAHLPPDVQAALARGDKIEAIKRLRAARGISLQAAKAVIDGHPQTPAQAPGMSAPGALPAEVVLALQRGQVIEAIRLLRKTTGLSLKQAKELVDAAGHQHGDAGRRRLSPGEVPRSNAGVWWVVGLLIAGLLVYGLLRGAV
jgi:ribosomal protein L7/L12